MAIDRIGKGGGVPPTPETQGTGAANKAAGAERPFSVEKPGASEQAQKAGAVDAASAASPLARLRAGAIDVHGYVDLKVEEATRNLRGLAPSELDAIKKVLREQMASDPTLLDLVRAATGHTPSPPED
jgi:hypothetical protein